MSETINLPQFKTIKCRIENIHPTVNNYTIVILETDTKELISISIPYNYEYTFKVGDIGVLTYEEVLAGMTHWYSKEDDRYYKHNYTVYYYKNFIPVGRVDNKEEKELYIS